LFEHIHLTQQGTKQFLSEKKEMGEKITIIDDEIEGSKIRIAVPKIWHLGLIIYCHGHRREGIELQADLDPEEESFKKLLQDGWMIAMTSYRKQGTIIKKALLDVNNLREYVVNKFEKPNIVILEGRSMGGCIVTVLFNILKRSTCQRDFHIFMMVQLPLGLHWGPMTRRISIHFKIILNIQSYS
jgi:hypothetical protein